MTFRSRRRRFPSTSEQRSLLDLESQSPDASFGRMLQNVLSSSQRASQPATSNRKLGDWLVDFIGFFNRCIDALDERDDVLDAQHDVHITGVFQDGSITATCSDAFGTVQVMVQSIRNQNKFACSCSAETSSGRAICGHVMSVLDHVTDLLEERYSNLSIRIQRRAFDPGEPDPKLFRFDPNARIKYLLESITPDDDILPFATNSAELAPLDTAQKPRIAWNLVINGSTATLNPMLQSPKKRGGWVKGRKVSLANLSQYADYFCDADRRVQALIRIETNYYNPQFNLSTAAAIYTLVGESNVLLNGEPAEVVAAEPCLNIEQGKQHLSFSIDGAHPSHSVHLFRRATLLAYSHGYVSN